MNYLFALNQTLKIAAVAAALSGALIATPSFAADATTPIATVAQAASTTQTVAQPAAQQQKTRAEVYQELVDAEKSGELARENAMYAGS
jgi:hypothetical protein